MIAPFPVSVGCVGCWLLALSLFLFFTTLSYHTPTTIAAIATLDPRSSGLMSDSSYPYSYRDYDDSRYLPAPYLLHSQQPQLQGSVT
eukprot:scaffold13646_cov137-Amphora_coffeaeformis.AAC.1